MHIKIISGMAEDQIYVTEVSQSGEFHRMILTQVQMSTLFAFGNKDVLDTFCHIFWLELFDKFDWPTDWLSAEECRANIYKKAAKLYWLTL